LSVAKVMQVPRKGENFGTESEWDSYGRDVAATLSVLRVRWAQNRSAAVIARVKMTSEDSGVFSGDVRCQREEPRSKRLEHYPHL
jgi:hypothetical protein